MAKIAHVVIGAGYGDEGKGRVTDYLVSSLTTTKDGPPINVRFNGGAQAGHTVIRHGKRHVFGHVGAGTFAGASTFLSSKFIFNPFVLYNELNHLRDNLNVIPRIEVHPDCLVTTAFDIMMNRNLEEKRGEGRHGSCGLGINETVTRSLGYPLTVSDLFGSFERRGATRRLLETIWYEWWLPRSRQLGINLIPPGDLSEATFKKEVENLSYAKNLIGNVTTRPDKNHSNKNCYVFEGAQGLELDEFLGEFPHVTRGVTGLLGAAFVAAEMGIRELHPIYVTRAYKTRHGAGPLPHEDEFITSKKLVDETNVTGPYQGKFRYAPLDVSRLKEIIREDVERTEQLKAVANLKISDPAFVVTCLDQIGSKLSFYDERGILVKGTKEDLIKCIQNVYPVKYVSYGASA